ncbi:MAG: hypothetical protein LBT83_08035, partial [Tannerella sp.]|nr:hypothetical protein [Tannerella sp.]
MMEWEELKKMWASLDERLEKQEVLKESMIREMIYAKSNKSLNRLINMEVMSLSILVTVIPAVVYLLYTPEGALLVAKLFCYYSLLIILYGLITGTMGLRYLMKIDFTKGIGNNLLYMNKYDLQCKRGKIISVFIYLIYAALGIYLYAELHATVTLWVFLGCCIAG